MTPSTGNKLPTAAPALIPPYGGYRDLQSYKMAEIVYDGTAVFCDRFIKPRSRTHDQMALICLIHQTIYLLDRQLRALEKAFLREGGFTERLYRTRSRARGTWKGPWASPMQMDCR